METLAAQPLKWETFDRNKRDYNDLTTLFAEMVDGSMRTPFSYTSKGQELYAQDGSPMGVEFIKGLETADEIADAKPNLCFEVRRRRSEIDEYHDMLRMAQGTLPNTMVVVSDFPAELMDATTDVGGYNVTRKQAMLRILAWDGSEMKMYSQSLDRSDRQALEAIYHSMGYAPRNDELLGQRMHTDLDEAEQNLLVDRLMGVYDNDLRRQFGGSWHAGIQNGARLNTYDFVREQRDIIQLALQQKRGGNLDAYKVAALLSERFRTNARLSPDTITARYHDPFHNLQQEMDQATYRASVSGMIFSACGITVESRDELTVGGQLQVDGYGNRTTASTEYKFDKRMYCVVCQAPPEEKAAKKMCGPCGICKECDKKLSK